jgi:hypothetical protein
MNASAAHVVVSLTLNWMEKMSISQLSNDMLMLCRKLYVSIEIKVQKLFCLVLFENYELI